ncbi:MAG: hypothetical protein R2865_07820 [Deinococcales bacterium]
MPAHHNQLPADLVEAFISQQKSLIAYPENGERLGDWKVALAIFSDSKKAIVMPVTKCLADEVAGNVGSSLLGYGARGQDEPSSIILMKKSLMLGFISPVRLCTVPALMPSARKKRLICGLFIGL